MLLNDYIQTLCALSGIFMILIGSGWIKSTLKQMLKQ